MPRSEDSHSLASRVRQLTAEDHRSAETASFITGLMGGERSVRDYALLVSQYHFIYEALDAAAETLRTETILPGVTALLDPKLDRRSAIQRDLATLLPETGLSCALVPMKATVEYVARIHQVANDPARLTAHHYLRYLGDLSGGLAIARLMQRHYQVPDHQLNMYTFESIEKPKLYKDAYRDQLNRLGLTVEQEETFIEEAGFGFGYNKRIFEELGDYADSLTPMTV
ncbi:MAG: biliverdin-producing heme oxygenase [Yaniella sp.]|nr:biliverdin-producing heme oxygenase [Yaniella sp.]